MRYRQLGASGLRVSVLSMGTMTFGGKGGFASVGSTDVEEARRQLDACLEAGVNLVDTANVYSAGLSRQHLIEACDASLRRLRADHIDLYQVHEWDGQTPLEETLDALDGLVRAGKVRYVGCSNYAGWQLSKALGISDRLGLQRFVSQQIYAARRRAGDRAAPDLG